MENLKEFQNRIDALSSSFKEAISILRTNRPSPRIVENIYVNYMEQNTQIKQLGSITVEMPRDIIITLWDKSLVPIVAKAIETAKLGLSVSALGNMVRAKLPELTTERRDEIIKLVKSTAEETRIKMRRQRDDVNKSISTEIDKDLKFKTKNDLQKRVDQFNDSMDRLIEDKIKDLSS
ncbi:MAG: ribosome-recycling factor [Patescibacteria group bacterium]